MSTDTTHRTTKLDRSELAEVLGVEPHTISGAAHGNYLCEGHPIHEWAVWHPRGNQVLYYQVPVGIIRDEMPRSDYAKFDAQRY